MPERKISGPTRITCPKCGKIVRLPAPEELAKEINGSALETLYDPADATKVVLEKGKQLPTFGILRDDGTTA